MYGVDLSRVLRKRTWRWFRVRVEYLLTIDGPLRRLMAPDPEPETTPSLSLEPPDNYD